MNVMRGIVNEDLVSVVPISIESEGNDWVEFELLLDTGFNGEVALERSLPDRHCLAPQPPGQQHVSYELLASWGDWDHNAGYETEHPMVGTTQGGLITPVSYESIRSRFDGYRTIELSVRHGGRSPGRTGGH